MTDKAYIVANEQQEMAVLRELEKLGAKWNNGEAPTKLTLAIRDKSGLNKKDIYADSLKFPYVIYCNGNKYVNWDILADLDPYKIIFYDGRKEERMSEKYVVSQEFINELEEWKNNLISSKRIYPEDISELYSENVIRHWWQGDGGGTDANNRLIAIIRWVNGEDVFEVEKPKKWIVRSKETDDGGHHGYVLTEKHGIAINRYYINDATRFDTKEEAESWANAHQEVIEVEK
ncbi:hypothetical protein [Weissella paramesenteroides]|uniref:hypothetical protein n=1 Tax=Weissella paramesenteroides TaxID=1249 RepID=UPI003D36311A